MIAARGIGTCAGGSSERRFVDNAERVIWVAAEHYEYFDWDNSCVTVEMGSPAVHSVPLECTVKYIRPPEENEISLDESFDDFQKRCHQVISRVARKLKRINE